MSGRVNKRGWIVQVSIPSDDGDYCVDLFELPAGGFGFQHFRSDPEDQGTSTPLGAPDIAHESATAAAAAAVTQVRWLTVHPRARQSLEDWLATHPT